MGVRFRLFRDYVAGVQLLRRAAGNPTLQHLQRRQWLGRASEAIASVNILVVIKPERPMLGIERALAAAVADSGRRPSISGGLAILHTLSSLSS